MLYAVGIIFIIAGIVLRVFPPKKINSIYGYRTNLSMKNQDAWNEGQKYSGNTFIVFGLIYCALEFALAKLIKNTNIAYQLAIFLIGIIIMLVIDEGHLRKVFNADGSRK
ncbi:SdpI family protein [Clostridium guangxiense]|uniref:SdpI family protein n=1 Tax=Clostridium guangxiense TaxID=1662055 RepID=UPI001E5A39AD|nr:SdpI family protein [Clostridium guangxiense]MCD2346796.1 SdpI family protein [Clostridium guangxiense]